MSIGDAAETQAAVDVWLYGPSAVTGSHFCSPLLLSSLPFLPLFSLYTNFPYFPLAHTADAMNVCSLTPPAVGWGGESEE